MINTLIKIVSNKSYLDMKLNIQVNPNLSQQIYNLNTKNRPSQIIVNGEIQRDIKYYIDSDLKIGINNITIIWDYILSDCYYMFGFGNDNIKSIDFQILILPKLQIWKGCFIVLH